MPSVTTQARGRITNSSSTGEVAKEEVIHVRFRSLESRLDAMNVTKDE
jgi:hypothetical protein